MRTQSNRNAKFSNPPTHTSFDHPEYLGQPDSYGDIPGHEVFSFLDLRVLWTLKSSLVLIFGMSFVDRKNPTKMVREANGQYDSIRAKFVKRCNLSGSLELQFLNLRKASRSFDRNLTQLHAKKIISKINKRWNILYLQISFSSMLREFKMLYILWREISLSLARGRHILLSCQFFSSLFFVRHPIICLSLLTNLFNKFENGYHFSFHRSMMKEFTIISTPDLCSILFTDVW